MPRSRRTLANADVSDETLMRRYAAGDPGAFEALFERYEPRVFGYFLSRIGSAERARDLYQELFLRVHRARFDFDPARAFSPWLFQIAHRLLVDDVRRAYRRVEVPLDARDLAARSSSGEAEAAERETLHGVLAALTAEERYVLVSAKVHGLDYRELGARLGKSTDAVKKLASRAMRRLRLGARAGLARPADL